MSLLFGIIFSIEFLVAGFLFVLTTADPEGRGVTLFGKLVLSILLSLMGIITVMCTTINPIGGLVFALFIAGLLIYTYKQGSSNSD